MEHRDLAAIGGTRVPAWLAIPAGSFMRRVYAPPSHPSNSSFRSKEFAFEMQLRLVRSTSGHWTNPGLPASYAPPLPLVGSRRKTLGIPRADASPQIRRTEYIQVEA